MFTIRITSLLRPSGWIPGRLERLLGGVCPSHRTASGITLCPGVRGASLTGFPVHRGAMVNAADPDSMHPPTTRRYGFTEPTETQAGNPSRSRELIFHSPAPIDNSGKLNLKRNLSLQFSPKFRTAGPRATLDGQGAVAQFEGFPEVAVRQTAPGEATHGQTNEPINPISQTPSGWICPAVQLVSAMTLWSV